MVALAVTVTVSHQQITGVLRTWGIYRDNNGIGQPAANSYYANRFTVTPYPTAAPDGLENVGWQSENTSLTGSLKLTATPTEPLQTATPTVIATPTGTPLTSTPTPTHTPTPTPTCTPTPLPEALLWHDGEQLTRFDEPYETGCMYACDAFDPLTGNSIAWMWALDTAKALGIFENHEKYLVELKDGRAALVDKWYFSGRPLIPEKQCIARRNYGFEDMILIGDSRFFGMEAFAEGELCFSKVGEGYDFLVESLPEAKAAYSSDKVIVIGLGINDTGSIDDYLLLVNELAKQYNVAYLNIGPVDEERSVKFDFNYFNFQLEGFNKKLKAGLSSDVIYLDVNAYLHAIGFDTVDGIHYTGYTYRNIYNFIRSNLIREHVDEPEKFAYIAF